MEAPDFWLPLSLEPLLHPENNWLLDRENICLRIYARLASGSTMGHAQAEMTVLGDYLRSLHDPRTELAKSVIALVWPGSPFPLPLNQFHGLSYVLLLILMAVGMVLVIACANVASLQLARAVSLQLTSGLPVYSSHFSSELMAAATNTVHPRARRCRYVSLLQ